MLLPETQDHEKLDCQAGEGKEFTRGGIHIYLRPGATLFRMHEGVWRPPTDVYETENAYQIKIELAGTSRDNINVMVENGLLSVRGIRSDCSRCSKIRFRQMEIKYGPFEVNLRLPQDVCLDSIEAVYQDGFLEITLPRQPLPKHPPESFNIPVD